MKFEVLLVTSVYIPDYFWYLNIDLFHAVDIVYSDLEGSIFCGNIFWKLQCAFLKETMFPRWDT